MGLRLHEVSIVESSDCFFEGEGPNHLITGNGFTMAYPTLGSLFSYANLLSNANSNSNINSMFTNFGTTNFEEILRVYDDCSKVVNIYEPSNTRLIDNLKNDTINLKEDFINSITSVHPTSSTSLSANHTSRCSVFLRSFTNVYTTNYDLFLYWVINSQNLTSHFSDGFTTHGGMGLHWNPDINGQNLFFLHGGLHIYTDMNKEICKITSSSINSIILQLNQNLLASNYPLVILEGSSLQKKQAIKRNKYLSYCYRSLASLTGKLLVYGMSFQFDDHILRKIFESNLSTIYFCLYGNSSQKQASAVQIQQAIRNLNMPINANVVFIDSSAFTIW
jgi:hypothetical protein